MSRIQDIFIANTAEAFADLLENSTSNDARKERISHEMDLSQRAQFWGGDNKIIITPEPIPAALLKCNKGHLGYGNVVNLWPKEPGLRLCTAITRDAELMDKLYDLLRGNPATRICSYAVTKEYVALVKLLRDEIGNLSVVNLSKIEKPAELAETIDSKNGFRTIIIGLFPKDGVKIPNGSICKDKMEVLVAILGFLNANKGFVIKIHKGESGWGIKIVDEEEAKRFDTSQLATWLDNLLQSEDIWEFAPYVVEEFIPTDASLAGGFPSGEGCISETGFAFSYICGQEVTREGEFEGISIDTSLAEISERIKIALDCIGNKLFTLGYRGVFDVDFAAGTDGNLYILECNARMTGGTHVYDAISHLKLNNLKNRYVFSKDSFRYGDVTLSPTEILQTLSDLLYPIDQEQRGILVSFLSSNRPVMGVVVIGDDRQDVDSLMNQMRSVVLKCVK